MKPTSKDSTTGSHAWAETGTRTGSLGLLGLKTRVELELVGVFIEALGDLPDGGIRVPLFERGVG